LRKVSRPGSSGRIGGAANFRFGRLDSRQVHREGAKRKQHKQHSEDVDYRHAMPPAIHPMVFERVSHAGIMSRV
jgi:hypothetical protein